MNDPGAYIKLEDGTIIPDLDDDAMLSRELLKEEEIKNEQKFQPKADEPMAQNQEGENNGTRTT